MAASSCSAWDGNSKTPEPDAKYRTVLDAWRRPTDRANQDSSPPLPISGSVMFANDDDDDVEYDDAAVELALYRG
jgi:hypothetical protein